MASAGGLPGREAETDAAFLEMRIKVDSLLKCAWPRQSNIREIDNLINAMRSLAMADALPQPTEPIVPAMPVAVEPNFPALPTPPEYLRAKSEYERRVQSLKEELSKNPHPEGSKKRRKFRELKRSELRKTKEEMQVTLKNLQIGALTATERKQYDEAIAAQIKARRDRDLWESQKAAALELHKRAMQQWENHPKNQTPKLRLKIVAKRQVRLDQLKTGHFEPPDVPTTKVSWRILPPPLPGEAGLRRLLEEIRQASPRLKVDQERLEFAYSLEPNHIYLGLGEFDGYLAFQFQNTPRILLECPIEGNAAYIFSGDWKHLSRLSKTELLQHHTTEVSRVMHKRESHWRSAIRAKLRLDSSQYIGNWFD